MTKRSAALLLVIVQLMPIGGSSNAVACPPGPTIASPTPKTAAAPKLGDQVTNSVGMKLVYIVPGEFQMGAPKSETARSDNEQRHKVRLTRPLYVGVYEVTVGEFRTFVAESKFRTDAEKDGKGGIGVAGDSFLQKPEFTWRNPGFKQDDKHPVTLITWNDAMAFCKWLSHKERLAYRLPTEAEWEYACRAGTTTSFAFGDSLSSAQANFDGRYPYGGAAKGRSIIGTTPVGSYKPNAWGLFDMHGNVGELCLDSYQDVHGRTASAAPKEASLAATCVLRGGSWTMFGEHCRSAYRNQYDRTVNRACYTGFRVVRAVE